MSHVTHEFVMSTMRISHAIHMKGARHALKRVMPPYMSCAMRKITRTLKHNHLNTYKNKQMRVRTLFLSYALTHTLTQTFLEIERFH